MAIKDANDLVELKKAKYLKNPFKALAGNISSTIILISLIPFVRNIIEYTKGEEDPDYLKLTSLLHFKGDTYDIDISALKRIFASMPNIIIPDRYNNTDKVIQLIYQAADECLNLDGSINLENKLALSIAMRIKTEEFIYNKIDDEEFKENLNRKQNQTWQLVTRYSKTFNNEKAVLRIINKVQLLTPENIHINSFMYEPILDMSDIELKKLYNEVKQIESKLIK